MLDKVGLDRQDKLENILRLQRNYYSPKFSVEQIPGDDVRIKAITKYPLQGEETVEFAVCADVYKKEIARSRPYGKEKRWWMPKPIARAVASHLINTDFGHGFGYDERTLLLPTRTLKQLRAEEYYPAEVTRHTWKDRLAEKRLLDEEFDGILLGIRITTRLASHADVLKALREMADGGHIASELRESKIRMAS